MNLKRRDFLKIMPFGVMMPGQLVSGYSVSARNASAAIPLQSGTRHTQDSNQIDQLYKNAIVIDALVITRDWGKESYKAAEKSGYTGFQTSLSSGNLETALKALAEWNQRIQDNADKLVRAVFAADFERAKYDGKQAILFGFQNATMIENSIDNLEVLYKAGTRWIQLTYNERNLLGDGCTERTNAGLSDFGIAVVERMNELGIIVDLSHCGRQNNHGWHSL